MRNGHSAELDVVRQIYDKAHKMIPGALVEDDSSWISWQRVHDFYDDHPYGNNHKWQSVLAGLDDFIRQRDPKPLVLVKRLPPTRGQMLIPICPIDLTRYCLTL